MASEKRRFAFETLEARLVLAAQPIITEFMASNNSTLLDGNGAASDWIELYNAGDQSVNLAGYTLTDDPQELEKWAFPSKNLAPGEYLIVFASGNSSLDSAGNLHTNFALSAGGEYLALTAPNGTILSEFGSATENYPAQSEDVSYGLGYASDPSEVVGPTTPVRYLIPTNSSVDATWTNPAFNDVAWTMGNASIGYETSGSDFASLIQTPVPAGTTTAYIRIPFNVSSLNTYIRSLQMKYDDGFVAYLNGTRIASANAPATLAYNSVSTDQHSDNQAVQYVGFDVDEYSHLLHVGQNTLAIHLLNISSGSSDLLLVPKLTLETRTLIQPPVEGFTLSPTPGEANTNLQASPVLFSRPGGTFSSQFQLVLSTGNSSETIHYTTDGSLPGATSPIYTGPINITTTTRIRARAFGPQGQLGSVSSEAFTRTTASTSSFNSDLPVIVLENFGQGTPGNDFEDAWFSLYDVDANSGRSSLAATANFTSIIGQHIRGSSTAGQPKTNLRIELRDDNGDDQNASLLGMPSESDWILYAPYTFDRAMIRNTAFYEFYRQMGHYAVRTRFVEVYANYNDGVLDSNDYMGVYVLMENIKIDDNRVDIASLNSTQNTEPEITGGYILKIDRTDGEPGASWHTDRGVPSQPASNLVYGDPEVADLTQAQRDYIRNYVQDFEDALYGPNSTDPVLGYEAYFDVDASIDHHIMQVFTKNPDGLRLSTYLVKDRNGKLSYGPIWDFDRAAGPDSDSRADDPTGWYVPDIDWFESDWWGPLFDDPDFAQRWTDRWQELRRGVLSDANIQAVVYSQAAELSEAEVRNFARWSEVAPNGGTYADAGLTGWDAEISQLANWLIARAHWMDEQMVAVPTLNPAAGNVPANTVVTLTPNQPGASIYYTLDGSDPRAEGGTISPAAILYTGPFVITQTTQVTARSKGAILPQSNSSYPGNESPGNALDGNSQTKYLNFGGQNSGLIFKPTSGASIVRSFKITTANDFSERDPASYELYGTNDPITSANNSTGLAENWTLISSGTLNLPEARRTDGPLVSFTNSTSYTAYKIVFPTLKNAAAANSMQLADLRLYQTTNGTGTQIQSSSDLVRAVHSVLAGSTEWSGQVTARYSMEVPADASNLRLTELNYHPANPTPAELALAPGTDDTAYEFLELRNISAQAISLDNVRFTVGITFNFSNGGVAVLEPGQAVVVVSNLTAFQARYGTGILVAGEFSGQLSNSGEQLLLVDASNQTIHDFEFDDSGTWPVAADGNGPSLEVISIFGDYSSGANWRASSVVGGTPGTQPGIRGDFNNDTIVDGKDFLAWQRGYGIYYAPADLLDWKAQYGSSGITATVAAIQATDTVTVAADAPQLPAHTTSRADSQRLEWPTIDHRSALLADSAILTACSPNRVQSMVHESRLAHRNAVLLNENAADAVFSDWHSGQNFRFNTISKSKDEAATPTKGMLKPSLHHSNRAGLTRSEMRESLLVGDSFDIG
jgi:hypothetical protein